MAEYINRAELIANLKKFAPEHYTDLIHQLITKQPTADVVEANKISEQIIRKNAEVVVYWTKDVKQYRAMKGYSDIEHDTDNFLRGYNEAVDDMLAILDGKPQKGEEK